MCQHVIPLGTIHGNKDSTVDVTFNSRDEIRVETGISFNGVFSTSGGRTDSFNSKTVFPSYSPTRGQKRVIGTVARFERYYTTDSFSGMVFWYHDLDRIIGGHEYLTGKQTCSVCDESWNSVVNDSSKLSIKVYDGGSYTVEEANESNYDVGIGVDLADEGFSGEVGVTRLKGSSTEITYTPDSGKDLLLYSDNMEWNELHVTSR